VVQEDYSNLGVVVVALALFFAVTFWLLKNTIDSLTGNAVYMSACALYAFSWLCRAAIDADTSRSLLLGVAYAVLGVILFALPSATDVVFVGVYLAAGVGALGYVLYRPPS